MNEDTHQILLMTWARKMAIAGRDELNCLIHVPNGGGRSKGEGAKLKAMGVKPGVSDLMLPVVAGGKAGLWIELKAENGVVSDEQWKWIFEMRKRGYEAMVAFGWEGAVTAIKAYLGGEWPEVDMEPSIGRMANG